MYLHYGKINRVFSTKFLEILVSHKIDILSRKKKKKKRREKKKGAFQLSRDFANLEINTQRKEEEFDYVRWKKEIDYESLSVTRQQM